MKTLGTAEDLSCNSFNSFLGRLDDLELLTCIDQIIFEKIQNKFAKTRLERKRFFGQNYRHPLVQLLLSICREEFGHEKMQKTIYAHSLSYLMCFMCTCCLLS